MEKILAALILTAAVCRAEEAQVRRLDQIFQEAPVANAGSELAVNAVSRGPSFIGAGGIKAGSVHPMPAPLQDKKLARQARRDIWMAVGGITAIVGTLGAFATIPFIVFAGTGGAVPAIAITAMVLAALGWAILWFADQNL